LEEEKEGLLDLGWRTSPSSKNGTGGEGIMGKAWLLAPPTSFSPKLWKKKAEKRQRSE